MSAAPSENYRISELAAIVAEIVPGCRIEYAPGGGPDKRCYRVNCDKIQARSAGFQPQWTARKGAQELHDAYRAAGLTAEDVKNGRYFRINTIQRLLKAGQLDHFSALDGRPTWKNSRCSLISSNEIEKGRAYLR